MNFTITSTDEVATAFIKLGILDFRSACNFVAHLPYKRNVNKNDILCVLNDQAGTCSSKHALLRKLALEHNQTTIQLKLGIIKMDATYAPAIAATLMNHNLDYIPEAHVYLKVQDHYCDFTNPTSRYSKFEHIIMKEYTIEYNQINDYKIALHKAYLNEWTKNINNHYSLEEIWHIREQCILDLQNAK